VRCRTSHGVQGTRRLMLTTGGHVGTVTEALTYDAVKFTSVEVTDLVFPTDGDFVVQVRLRTHSVSAALCAISICDFAIFG